MITNDWFLFRQHILSIWLGNIVSVLKSITDFPTSDNRFSSIGPIYYEYGSMVSMFDSRRISINNKLNIINNIMLTMVRVTTNFDPGRNSINISSHTILNININIAHFRWSLLTRPTWRWMPTRCWRTKHTKTKSYYVRFSPLPLYHFYQNRREICRVRFLYYLNMNVCTP